jgi:hypothetical protein
MTNDQWWEGLKRAELTGATLVRRVWTRPKGDEWYDHDHCNYCFAKFSDTEPNALREGFATLDEAVWVCSDCANISALRDYFHFTVAE